MRMLVSLLALLVWVWPPAEARAADTLTLSHIPNDRPTAQAFRILEEAYRRLGITVREELLPHERSLRAASAGEVDGDVMRITGIEVEFPNLVRVPEPVYHFDTYVFTTGLNFKIEGWESLRPYSICVSRGMKLAEQGTEGMNRELATSVDQMVEMLRRGRCQAGLFGRLAWLEFDRLQAGPIRQLEPPVSSLPLFHYVNHRHSALVPRLTETLRQMRADGATAAIIADDEKPVAEARKRTEAPSR